MKSLLLCATVLCLILSQPALATVIFSDNFNLEHGGVGVLNYNAFTNWTVSDGTVDLIGNGFWDLQPGNGLYIDMDGSTSNAGKMTSKMVFSFMPGIDYTLSFDLAGNQRYSKTDHVIVQVALGTILSHTYSIGGWANFSTYSHTFSVSTPTSGALSFEGLGGDNVGLLLDNVQLTAIPEPTSLLLLGAGLIGLSVISRTRKRKS